MNNFINYLKLVDLDPLCFIFAASALLGMFLFMLVENSLLQVLVLAHTVLNAFLTWFVGRA